MNIIEWRDALLESPLNYKAKYIGLILSQFYRHKHPTYPSIRTLSQLSSLTVNPVQEGIGNLIAEGFIKRSQERLPNNKFISNLYVFVNVEQNEHVSPRDTSDDTSDDTSPRDTKVDKVDKVDKVVKKKVYVYTPEFIEFWQRYGAIGTKGKAAKAFSKIKKEEYWDMYSGLEKYQAYARANDWYSPKHASTWLNERGWESKWQYQENKKPKGESHGNTEDRRKEAIIRSFANPPRY